MSGILVWAETRNRTIRKSSLEAIAVAHKIVGDTGNVSAVLIGEAHLAETLASWPLKTVYVIEGDLFCRYQSEPFVDALHEAVKQSGATTIIAAATALGRDLTARLAARLDAALATDVTSIDTTNGLVVQRPAYSGKLVAHYEFAADTRVISIRPNVFDAATATETKAAIQAVTLTEPSVRAVIREAVAAAQGAIDLTEADIIVAGGRGVGGPEGFKLLEETARLLNGAVGASRTAVDEGWAPYSSQVGQTGKVVSPILYIACGISGAIQHFAGMGSSRFILAINTDPEAPIMKKADFAIVGDLFKILPALREELQKHISQ